MFFLGTLREWVRDRARNIFRFHNGFQRVQADPIVLATRLEQECPDYQDLLDTLRPRPGSVPPGPLRDDLVARQKDATRQLVAVARRVFHLLPLSETGRGGTTDAEAVGVLGNFFVFLEQAAGDAELFPAWPGRGSPSPPASATESSWASGTAAG